MNKLIYLGKMMAALNNRIKYCTSISGYYIYRNDEIDRSKFKDCIVVHEEHCTNVMIIDHIPDDTKGWNVIRNINSAAFKLISDGNPCTSCTNVYECMFKKTTPLVECIEACGSLLKKQNPLPGFKYVKPGYTVYPFCAPELFSIMLDEASVEIRTKEIQEASARGCYTRKFKQEHCVGCVFGCNYVPKDDVGCKFTQAELYDTLDKEIKIRFGSYEKAMSMLVNCGKILWINRRKYIVAAPITSNYYLIRKISKPFTLKFLKSKHLGTKTVKCTKQNIMNLRTMVAYQNSVNMFLSFSNEWRVFFGGYILPMAFIDMDNKRTDLTVYCKQPTKLGRRVYYKDPEEVIRIQCYDMNWNFNVLYPTVGNLAGRKKYRYTSAEAINETKRFFKAPEKCLRIYDTYSNKYKAIEVINNSKIKQGGKLQW